jgi:hypothetical protein
MSEKALYPIRAHLEDCPHSLRIPVDLCGCGGRDFTPDHPLSDSERRAQMQEHEETKSVARNRPTSDVRPLNPRVNRNEVRL